MTCEFCQRQKLSKCDLQSYAAQEFPKIMKSKAVLADTEEVLQAEGLSRVCPYWIQVRDFLRVSIRNKDNIVYNANLSETSDPVERQKSPFLANVGRPPDLPELPPDGKRDMGEGFKKRHFPDNQTS